MRLPFLKLFIDDSRVHGATLAALAKERLGETCGPLKSSPRWWRGLLEDLWDYGVKVSGDARPDGVVRGKAAAAVLVSCIGDYPGPALELLLMLEACGLIERGPDQLRVKGVEDLYGEAWDDQQTRRDKASKAAKARWDSKPADARSMPQASSEHRRRDAKTETETETEREDLPSREAAKAARPPRKLSAAEDFYAWAVARRAARTPLSEETPSARAINGAFGRALNAVGRPTLEKCYLAFLDEPDGASKEPPWPWQSFLARYPSLQRRAAATSQTESRAL